ncbi:MAG: hypothetical protein SFY66_19840 [Oculatellaceae cyanobacterium bins.114]|nr:hypothetical protein [Oculatellaceae cyanobacterium bins.114]
MIKFYVQPGDIFGDWEVIQESQKADRRRRYILCKCTDCGKEKEIRLDGLRSGANNKCRGCFMRRLHTTHGCTHNDVVTAEYTAWKNIKKRCNNVRAKEYKNYGGRGIKVCDRWANSFENFLADMGKRPTKNHSIERIDSDGDYSPENCKWATRGEQNRNMRNNRWITFEGETLVLGDWSERLQIPFTTLHYRLKAGWGVEKALTTPVQHRSTLPRG